MNEVERIDKMNDWKVSGENTIDNALKATVNKWNEVLRYADEANEMISVVCGFCDFVNGNCEKCILEKLNICTSNISDMEKFHNTLYAKAKIAGKAFIEAIDNMLIALDNVSYIKEYKDKL